VLDYLYSGAELISLMPIKSHRYNITDIWSVGFHANNSYMVFHRFEKENHRIFQLEFAIKTCRRTHPEGSVSSNASLSSVHHVALLSLSLCSFSSTVLYVNRLEGDEGGVSMTSLVPNRLFRQVRLKMQ